MLQRNKVALSTGYKIFQVSNKRTLYEAPVHFSHSILVSNRCLLLPNSSLHLSGRILINSQSRGSFFKPGTVARCVSFWKKQNNIFYCKMVKDSNRNSVNYSSGSVRKRQLISVTLGFLLFHRQGNATTNQKTLRLLPLTREFESHPAPVHLMTRCPTQCRTPCHQVWFYQTTTHHEDWDRVSSHTSENLYILTRLGKFHWILLPRKLQDIQKKSFWNWHTIGHVLSNALWKERHSYLRTLSIMLFWQLSY